MCGRYYVRTTYCVCSSGFDAIHAWRCRRFAARSCSSSMPSQHASRLGAGYLAGPTTCNFCCTGHRTHLRIPIQDLATERPESNLLGFMQNEATGLFAEVKVRFVAFSRHWGRLTQPRYLAKPAVYPASTFIESGYARPSVE